MTNHPNDNVWVSLSDLILICKQAKRKIITCSVIGALLAGFYTLTRPMEYTATATFREKATIQNSNSSSSSLTAMLLGTGRNSSYSEAISTMQSRLLLGQLVKEQNLQGTLVRKGHPFELLANLKKNLLVEYSLLKGKKGLILSDNHPALAVQHISYDGESPLKMRITFLTDDTFQVLTSRKASPIVGSIDSPVVIESATFTLKRNNSDPLALKEYFLFMEPLNVAIQMAMKKLVVETDHEDKTLLKLKYSATERHVSSRVLNGLMGLYQKYLKHEQERVSHEQIAYLENRQDEIKSRLRLMMEEHANILSSDVLNFGFPDVSSAMNFFASAQQQCSRDLLALDLELKHLQHIQKGGIIYLVNSSSAETFSGLSDLIIRMRELRHQADSIELALGHEWKEKQQRNAQNELLGIDLQTTKELFLEYSKKLNSTETEIAQTRYIIEQMKEPSFEISSLSTVLSDPVSQKMIATASAILLSLKDESNRSLKEQERLRSELAIQKGFLSDYLNQTVQLLKLSENLLREKIYSIQIITLDLIQREILVLERHLADHVSMRISQLIQQKNVIEQHQQELQQEMATLPNKWVSEKLVDQQMDLNARMVEEITKMVESKNTSSSLDLIQSAPVDSAFSPVHPKSPQTFLFLLYGAALGALLSSSFFITRTIVRGIPVTAANLKLAQQHVSGTLSKLYQNEPTKLLPDHDLETLRRLIVFFESSDCEKEGLGRTATLIIGQEAPDYSQDLAVLLAKKGKKSIVVPLFFEKPPIESQQPGLLQYLEGKAADPKIIEKNGFDMIAPGGISRFAHEFIGSARFHSIIAELQKCYDWVLIVTRASSDSSEAESLLRLTDVAVITIKDQCWDEIKTCCEVAGVSFIII